MFVIQITNILVSSAISEDGFLSGKIDLIKLEEYEPENEKWMKRELETMQRRLESQQIQLQIPLKFWHDFCGHKQVFITEKKY